MLVIIEAEPEGFIILFFFCICLKVFIVYSFLENKFHVARSLNVKSNIVMLTEDNVGHLRILASREEFLKYDMKKTLQKDVDKSDYIRTFVQQSYDKRKATG